ncbi:MAG: hypothetical protein GY926_04820 [bacterium]|nr:hypothetical protein [bacterium]
MTLERRYRRTIRLFPRTWREQNEDVLVDTLLEQAGSDRNQVRVADQVDLLRTAAVLHWRALCGSPVRADASASVLLAASAGLALMTATALGLLVRLWVIGFGLRYGSFPGIDLLVATPLLAMWPLALLLATTRRTRLSLSIAGSTTMLLAVCYLARSNRAFNFVTMDHALLYIGLPLIVTLALATTVYSGHQVDRRWITVAGLVAIPLTAVLAGGDLHHLWQPPKPYDSPTFTIVAAFVLAPTPVILAIGIFRPQVLLAAGLLCTPLSAAGLGQLIDSLTIHNPRPGQAIAETPQAIAVAAGSLLPTTALMLAGIAASLHQARRADAR